MAQIPTRNTQTIRCGTIIGIWMGITSICFDFTFNIQHLPEFNGTWRNYNWCPAICRANNQCSLFLSVLNRTPGPALRIAWQLQRWKSNTKTSVSYCFALLKRYFQGSTDFLMNHQAQAPHITKRKPHWGPFGEVSEKSFNSLPRKKRVLLNRTADIHRTTVRPSTDVYRHYPEICIIITSVERIHTSTTHIYAQIPQAYATHIYSTHMQM